jgi:hypothetical protein
VSEYRSPVPPGWPKQVDRPGAPDSGWETSAVRWLYDQAPGAWRDGLNGRQYPDRPLMLARDVRYLVDGQINGLREAYRRARVELAEKFEPNQIAEQLNMYQQEAARLEALLKQVQVVEDALSGIRWVPRKADVTFDTLN